jgi:hypothetical protein
MERECICLSTKKHRLVFDGGVSGNYTVFLCDSCNSKEDKQFLISEELLLGGHT